MTPSEEEMPVASTWNQARVWNEAVRGVLAKNSGTRVIAAGSYAPAFQAADQAPDGGSNASLH